MVDIERFIETNIVTGLRTVFSTEEEHNYSKDSKATRIIISGAFPNKDAEMKIPQLVITQIAISIQKTSLFANYYGDIIENGIVKGQKFKTIVPYSVSIVCLSATDSSSKDLAGKVLNYITFAASEFFDNDLQLNIQGAQKAQGGPHRFVPNKAFAHTVSLNGTLHWSGVKIPEPKPLFTKIRLEIEKK